MEGLFLDITLILVLATGLALVFGILKQPAVLAYILAGILIGPLGFFALHSPDALHGFSDIGITLLLFLLGLELKLDELKSVGKVALLTGIGQIVFTSAIGFGLALLLGFGLLSAVYISVGLTFSSTIIIVKLLSDKKDLNSLYGKIAVGFLLVQDFVAIIALIMLSAFSQGGDGVSAWTFLMLIAKAAALFGVVIALSKAVLPYIVHRIAHSSELLFLFSVAWAFGISALVSSPWVGFSVEIGGFLAGLALAGSAESYQMVSRVRPLRDFFITVFFVMLGTGMAFDAIAEIWFPALLLSIFVLIGNPLIVMVILGLLGYRKRTSFLAGLTVAQISEFSLIVLFLGNRLGHVPDTAISLMTLVAVITFTLSTYAIMNGKQLYEWLKPLLGIFERSHLVEPPRRSDHDLSQHIVLVGLNRIGGLVLEHLDRHQHPFVAVDFDPDLVEALRKQGHPVVFGDITDPEIQERAAVEHAKLVISTVPDMEDNRSLLRALRAHNPEVKVLVTAVFEEEIDTLYAEGADYVVMPHRLAGQLLAEAITRGDLAELGPVGKN